MTTDLGSPLTSEDVKASYERIINPPPGVVSSRKSYYADLMVDVPDPATVVFKLRNPMAGVLEALARWESRRFGGYFEKEKPFLDGYKVFS